MKLKQWMTSAMVGVLWLVGTALSGAAEPYVLAFFPAASGLYGEGFVRIINLSPRQATASIEGFYDVGARFRPFDLVIDAPETTHFNSGDLEDSLGDRTGDWRLHLESSLDVEVLVCIRTSDGFVTTMYDVAATSGEGTHHYVPFFNPGSNLFQVSRLRIVNPGDEPVDVRIVGRDDAGEADESAMSLSVAAGTAYTVTAQALESGEGVSGALGDGNGKWSLTVTADGTLHAMSPLRSRSAHFSNPSAPGLRRAPFPGCDNAHGDVVDIPHVVLRRAIGLALGLLEQALGEQPISRGELASLTALKASGFASRIDVRNLTDLECPTRLTTLELLSARLPDLTPLARLTGPEEAELPHRYNTGH